VACRGGLGRRARRSHQAQRDTADAVDEPALTLKVAARVRIPYGLLTHRLEQIFRDVRTEKFHPGNTFLAHEAIGKLCLGVNSDDEQRRG
jgi:hypothetical protein